MTVQWPTLKARLVELAPTLDGWDKITVYPGPIDTATLPIDEDTQRAAFATVGYTTADESGTFTTEQHPDGYQWVERGTVHIEITIQIGATDAAELAGLEAELFAALSGLEGACRADRRLGVLSQEGTASIAAATIPLLNNLGTAMVARAVVTYLTVT